jgi:REP element-mobilizing transposase RayT
MKYRRVVISEEIDETLKEICEEISKRYEIKFLELGREGDHVHFLVQSVSMHSPTKIVKAIKSILAKKIFERHPEVKKQLCGGEFWAEGHFISRVKQRRQ